MVLYADILFIIDFSMDVLTLWAAGRLTHSKLITWRVAVAAAIGAIISVSATVIGASRTAGYILGFISAFLMSIITFGIGSPFNVIRRYLVLWIGGVLLGGIMTALMSAGSFESFEGARSADTAVTAIIPIGAFFLFTLVSAIIRSPKCAYTDVILSAGGRHGRFRAICDSGNLLVDPFSGESVILVRRDAANSIFSEPELAYLMSETEQVPPSIASRVRLIPSSSLGGDVLLKSVRIDRVTVANKCCCAVVAVTDMINGDDYDAVVSTKLL